MSSIAIRRVGIIMNGVTGRMGTNQHLMRSIMAIRQQGGVEDRRGRSHPARSDPGRPQPGQAGTLAAQAGLARWTTRTSTKRWPTRTTPIYFDAQTTDRRVGRP